MSPPGGNRGSRAAVEVEGIGSLAAVLSFLSDLPGSGFFVEGIFLLYESRKKKSVTGRGCVQCSVVDGHVIKWNFCTYVVT